MTMGVLYTDLLPAAVWREIAKQTTNLEFRAQIRDELSKHSENDTLRIRIDHIIEQQPPAPSSDEVTLVLDRSLVEWWIAVIDSPDAWGSKHVAERLQTALQAALAAAQAQPGGEARDGE